MDIYEKIRKERIRQIWDLIESLNYQKDGDYSRCLDFLVKNQTDSSIQEARLFVIAHMERLSREFGNKITSVSYDSWSGIRAEVVSRGRKFYENITLEELERMHQQLDYNESFLYCFHFKATYVYSEEQKNGRLESAIRGGYYMPNEYIKGIEYTDWLTSKECIEEHFSIWSDSKIVHVEE